MKSFRYRSTCEEVSYADREVCSLTRVRMVFLFKKRTLRCLHGGVAALISLLLLRPFAEKPQERVIFKGGGAGG